MADCSCSKCQDACRGKPGWFLPGEAEAAAALRGQTLQEFFDQALGVDWWEEYDGPDTYILTPALVQHRPGTEYPGDPRGACVLFEEGKCTIHEAKPFECRHYIHDHDNKTVQRRKRGVRDAWKEASHQQQIEGLLGREPESRKWRGW
jgi:Fe-S-cluster containining protein